MIISDTTALPLPEMEEVPLTAEEKAAWADRRVRYGRNMAWYQDHAVELARAHLGKFVCVAGQELFVGDDPAKVRKAAEAKHPGDAGALFTLYLSPHRGPKIYANRRLLGVD